MNTTTLITGASRGLGLAIARNLAARGHRLVLVARDGDALQRAAASLVGEGGERPLVLDSDLAAPAAVPALVERLRQRRVGVDMLVNNAGIGLNGAFTAGDPGATGALARVLAFAGMLPPRGVAMAVNRHLLASGALS